MSPCFEGDSCKIRLAVTTRQSNPKKTEWTACSIVNTYRFGLLHYVRNDDIDWFSTFATELFKNPPWNKKAKAIKTIYFLFSLSILPFSAFAFCLKQRFLNNLNDVFQPARKSLGFVYALKITPKKVRGGF